METYFVMKYLAITLFALVVQVDCIKWNLFLYIVTIVICYRLRSTEHYFGSPLSLLMHIFRSFNRLFVHILCDYVGFIIIVCDKKNVVKMAPIKKWPWSKWLRLKWSRSKWPLIQTTWKWFQSLIWYYNMWWIWMINLLLITCAII